MAEPIQSDGRFVPIANTGQAPPGFGDEAVRFGTITIPLDDARDKVAFQIGGNLLWAVDASSIAAALNVHFQEQRSDPIPYKRGLMIRGARFDKIYVSNASQPGASITLAYTTEREGRVQVENPAAQFNDVDLSKAGGLATTADVSIATVTTAQVLAANANRREAVITNLQTNASEVRVGDSNAGVTRGTPLQPGDSIVLTTTAAIHVYNADAAAQSVALLETED